MNKMAGARRKLAQPIGAAFRLLWIRPRLGEVNVKMIGAGMLELLGDKLPNTPAHEVMMRAAVGDHSVPTAGAHVMARTLGVPMVDSGGREVWGLETVAEPPAGSAYIEYDFGLPPEAYFDPNSPDAIADALKRALADPKAYVADAGRYLTWNAVAERTLDIYRGIAPFQGSEIERLSALVSAS